MEYLRPARTNVSDSQWQNLSRTLLSTSPEYILHHFVALVHSTPHEILKLQINLQRSPFPAQRPPKLCTDYPGWRTTSHREPTASSTGATRNQIQLEANIPRLPISLCRTDARILPAAFEPTTSTLTFPVYKDALLLEINVDWKFGNYRRKICNSFFVSRWNIGGYLKTFFRINPFRHILFLLSKFRKFIFWVFFAAEVKSGINIFDLWIFKMTNQLLNLNMFKKYNF